MTDILARNRQNLKLSPQESVVAQAPITSGIEYTDLDRETEPLSANDIRKLLERKFHQINPF